MQHFSFAEKFKNVKIIIFFGANLQNLLVTTFFFRVRQHTQFRENIIHLLDNIFRNWLDISNALGNRSILADPRSANMKDIINEKVKHRESFRPFAPSVLSEFCSEYFDIDCESPYMLLVAKVKKPDLIPAITHIDGTARIQTVTKDANGIFYDLINDF